MKANTMKANTIPAPSPLRYSRTVNLGKERITIKITLADDCHNGHEHFSLTADIYEKSSNGSWVDVGGGCCHNLILEVAPELAPFAALHLADQNGVPMHGIANGFYWYAGTRKDGCGQKYHGGSGREGKPADECRRILVESLRLDPDDIKAIEEFNPRTPDEFQYICESLNLPVKWKRQAQEAIATLESLSGQVFVSGSTRPSFTPLPPETRKLIEERRASGYYEPEQVAARDEAARVQRIADAVAGIEKDYTSGVAKLDRNRMVDLYFVTRGMFKPNAIYYDHTNEISFNWTSTEKLVSRGEFDAFVASADMDALPPGMTFKFNERPKY